MAVFSLCAPGSKTLSFSGYIFLLLPLPPAKEGFPAQRFVN